MPYCSLGMLKLSHVLYSSLSNALLRDLTYPNEYVRGSTLRFLCKLSDEEILAPLVEAVRSNLKHRLAYVRRNAVLASYSIVTDHPALFPDGIDLVYSQLLEVH